MKMSSLQVFYREVHPLSVAGKIALEDASARHGELLELERSLSLLQEMFQDMHDMVHSQVIITIHFIQGFSI